MDIQKMIEDMPKHLEDGLASRPHDRDQIGQVCVVLGQALRQGKIDEDAARCMLENSPRIGRAICEALTGAYGRHIGPRELMVLAKEGRLRGGVLESALTL